jgi:N-acetylneuraminic acid mutarotase
LHQSVVVKGKGGAQTLYAIGGRASLATDSWLNTVESLDLTLYMNPKLRKVEKGEDKNKPIFEVVNWQTCAPMQSKRAGFAALAIDNQIYVFGGIQGREGSHKPILTQVVVERYNPQANEWSEYKINNAPQVASFSWAPISNDRIVVFGGTNGSIITNDLYIVDFAKKEAEMKETDYEGPVANGKMAYRASDDSLYIVGGIKSLGENYSAKLSDLKWVKSEKSHSVIIGETDLELPYKEAIYFP